ncbi:AAA family ATPase [Sanguibacter suaedae]|uniref:Nuclease SbcCD subunit C n=1 Tax=Sanguibacter suaedae TaxID=2795737 RepID=A0A934I9B0_9MICO|nr:SMC family ATPase [Sanguibacter suaedae]MBI9113595.1 SMC family ATPase [Sanguibacter suaedae]
MHLHSLRIQAVGPFAGEHVVDFAALAASGIFLLEGPTGAGKSTIIDAVVFALYGKVASASASEDRLRSSFAPDDVDSVVDLTFETGAGAFRVVRTPERLRRKKRGDGTTKQQASVRLWRLPSEALAPGATLGAPGDAGELVASRLDEAGLELQRVVGLDRTQFVQTVVLPQGEFAGFLRARPEDRGALLQKVFGTEVYDRAQTELAGMRAAAQRDLDTARGAVTAAVDGFVVTADLDEDAAGVLRDARAEDTPKLSAEHVAGLEAAADALALADTAARTDLDAARATLTSAQRLAEALHRRAVLLAEQDELAERAAHVVEQETALDVARRAAVVRPLLDGEHDAQLTADRLVAEAAAAFDGARGVLPDGTLPDLPDLDDETGAGADAAEADLRARRDADARRASSLERLVAVEASLPVRRDALARDRAALEGRRAEAEERARDLDARPVARTALEAGRDHHRAVAAELTARTAVAAAARTVVETLDTVDALRVDLDGARATLTRAADRARDTAAQEHDLRQRRIDGIAGEIATTLKPGVPCPVCGGAEHPAPAPLHEDHVTQDAVDDAQAVRESAERDLVAAERTATLLAERHAAAIASTGGAERSAAVAALDAASTAVTEAETARDSVPVAEQALADFDAETAGLLAEATALRDSLTGEAARLDRDAADLDRDTFEVAEAVRGLEGDVAPDTGADVGTDSGRPGDAPPSVAAAVEALESAVTALDALLDARREARAALRARDQRVAERTRTMAEQGFATLDALLDARLGAQEQAALEAAVTGFRSDEARVRAGLAAPEIVGLAADAHVDLPAAEQVVADAEAACRSAAEAATLATRRAADAGRAARTVEGVVLALNEAQVRSEPVLRMANLATGNGADNTKRLTLATFVLMRRFEDVVAAANERLTVMSDGRYELERSDDKEKGGGLKVGLALRVVDHHTGVPRLASSLSGGETFYVSLCLALGMADVVTAEAGGVHLGTLFVDEGFGTLDPETLDSVLQVLGGLRAGGRVVGVVSHVETLKQTIADGISVRRLADGSSTLTVRAG